MTGGYILFICLIGGCLALPSKRGACVISCNPGNGLFDDLNLMDCPDDHSCHSTGCGAFCVADKTDDNSQSSLPRRRDTCAIQCSPAPGMYEDLNLPECPKRFYCASNGCGTMCRPYL